MSLILIEEFQAGRRHDGDPLCMILLKPALRSLQKVTEERLLQNGEDYLKGDKDGKQNNDVLDLKAVLRKLWAEAIRDSREP